MKQKKKEKLSDKAKGNIYADLLELLKTRNKKVKYKYHDRDDLEYHGIRDIENLFDNVNDNDYYKPILVKSSLKKIINIMKAEAIRQKIISKAISLQDYAIFK